ncbi:prolyl oligopeptidase family serine peptidase [Massilia sp. ST3]|uniref:S9 family peptidase n=1 Tax=Massilia sp. ST3 TaxID=2824903 RepID=UPI001B82EDAE|nr:prolyl oligopeptidase family serine peptidase [Massilia sp. ST3]MBQ5947857.1 S9 family peptidase [Massilia sp. ST3]
MDVVRPRGLAALLLACCGVLLPAAASAQAPALPPIEKFFANPQLGAASLSPGGRHLAALSATADGRDALVVVDLQTNEMKVVAGYKNVDVLAFQWVNGERLLFNVRDNQTSQGGTFEASGLYAVNRDGSSLRQLAARRWESTALTTGSSIKSRLLPWHTYMLDQRGPQDSDWTYVLSGRFGDNRLLEGFDLLRLNTVSGQAETVQRPGPVHAWLLDNAGEPRLAVGAKEGTSRIYYRDPAGGQWRTIASFPTYDESPGVFAPEGFAGDGTLYVTARAGKDTAALHTFDFATGKISPEPVVVTEGYDFNGSLISRRGKLLGVSLLTDARGQVWFDPGMQELQKKVDAALPGTVNLLSVAADSASPWVLVRSYSDRQPGIWMMYNRQTNKLGKVSDSYPGIDPKRMGRQQPVRYKARDGREIPGLLTLPPGGGKNHPMVVLVHGGPYVRGSSWGWDPESQFLASRGYAVLEPAFRGSTGFGAAHFRAGWRQWGLAMQDDIADGVRWAVAQGHADPKRVCIAGGSYGGYATLMGLARDPDLYKCGVNWMGVTDINLLYDGHWSFESDLGADWKKYGMPLLVGDQVRDADQLKATSPIEQAARITQPLILAYGGVDKRVPMYHGSKFRDAVSAANKQVEWIEYQDEGHGWSLPKNQVDFWGRVEKFLDKHIGNGAGR